MGCRHSSSPPVSPKLIVKKNGHSMAFKKQIFLQQSHKLNSTKSNKLKSIRTTKSSPSFNLEHILDGHGQCLIKRFEFNSPCLLFDLSPTHILLLDNRQFCLIHINTMNTDTYNIPNDKIDIQDIVWSIELKTFLVLTSDQLFQTDMDPLQLKSVHQIQFINEGHRKSYMTVNGNDLVINRSFGRDLRHYSLSNFNLIQSCHLYKENQDICVTTIQLNSKKMLALAISIGEKQMIDLVHLNTHQFIRRIQLDLNENISYPIDLHDQDLWFTKTSIPYVNIGHCLISSDGQISRLKLFTNQDNFIRSFRISCDNRWLLISRQYALELYTLSNSLV